MSHNRARRRLARIRCVLETVNALRDGKALPEALCFVPQEIEYRSSPDLQQEAKASRPLIVRCKPSSSANALGKIPHSSELRIFVSGEEFSNGDGDWIKLSEKTLKQLITDKLILESSEGWILLQTREVKVENIPALMPSFELDGSSPTTTPSPSAEDIFGGSANRGGKHGKKVKSIFYRWQDVVEDQYVLHIIPPKLPLNTDQEALRKLQVSPPNWNLDSDEELIRFLIDNMHSQETFFGGASKYVERVEVSTEQDGASNLLDGDPDTFWESDGSQGRHYIRLHMKPGVVIQQLLIGVDQSDDNYMPYRIVVSGTTDSGTTKQLNDTHIDTTFTGDVCVLENAAEFYRTVEIKIKECKDDGIDCRIHCVKIVSSKQKQNGLNRELFNKDLVRYPKLDSVDKDHLYKRAQVLLRFVFLLDSVIHFLLPAWEYTAGTFKSLECIRQLLPLSKKRNGIIANCLRETQSSGPNSMPKIYLNRHLAAEHLVDPAQDPEAKQSIFNQLYEALRPERCGCKLDFRWSQKYDQWWECKFVGEGIIDQGGGFRDTLADMAEELCPSSPDSPVPLPFFVRSPNQTHESSNVNRDCYVPNPSCKLFSKYEWVGMIMGACLRGKENLVISLPAFIWKCLVGEKVTWNRDYATVDAAEVKLHETLEALDNETFEEKFGGVLTYTTVLSNGSVVAVKPREADKNVKYEDRVEYLQMVKKIRMYECKDQIDALRRGLLRSVPKAVLDLLTWQELEKKICGDPEISVEALKKSTHYEDLMEDDVRVRYLWKALEKFSNEDRSRFLRFVTGRRRLPTPLYICPSKSSLITNRGTVERGIGRIAKNYYAPLGRKTSTPIDSLPESATCSSTLFLPPYSNAQMAEEKIRYAAYNCIAIDADMSPWEE